MLRARRKKRKGKREKRVKKKCVDERETLFYEQQILDNNRELARLRSRNEELEVEAKVANEKFRQVEEDRSDVIAYLKRNLEEKIEESKELSERLSALEELRKDERAAIKKKEEAMEFEYRTMENNLSAEVRLAAGKLNALEDWRLARLDLLHKFEVQEKEIADQEEKHKTELYEAEKSVIIGKAMMKKEMEERLKTLSEELRKATNLRVAEATHRAIRENIVLNHEHDRILKICRELEITGKEHKENERVLRLQCELFETESKITAKMVLKQRDAIHKVTSDYELTKARYKYAEGNNMRFAEYERIADNLKEKNKQMEEEIRLLEKGVQKTRNDKEQLWLKVREKEEELDALASILNRARSCIKEALQLQGDISNANYCASHLKQQLLQCLWEILETENITNILGHTASQIEDIKCPYVEGCLGLIEPLEDKKDDVCYTKKLEGEGTEPAENLVERRPSCLDSDISSNIPSPQESDNYYFE